MFLFQDGMFENIWIAYVTHFGGFSSILENLHLYLLWERGKEWVGTRLCFNLKLFGSLFLKQRGK